MTEEIKQEVKPEPTLLEQTQKSIQELKEQLDRKEQLLQREEQLRSNSMLWGKSEAAPAPEPKVETAQEYAKRVMSGKL